MHIIICLYTTRVNQAVLASPHLHGLIKTIVPSNLIVYAIEMNYRKRSECYLYVRFQISESRHSEKSNLKMKGEILTMYEMLTKESYKRIPIK